MRVTKICFSFPAIRALTPIVALLLVAGGTVNSNAAVISAPNAIVGGTVNNMIDTDYEAVYRPDGAGGYTLATGNIQTGDILLAVAQYYARATTQQQTPDVIGSGQLTAISMLQVASINPTGPNAPNYFDAAGGGTSTVEKYTFGFTSASQATWNTLTGKSGPSGNIVSVYDNANQTFTVTSGSQGTDIASYQTGGLLWNFGFTGSGAGGSGPVAANASAGEGWSAIAPINPGDLALISPIEAAFKGALNQLPGGTGPVLSPDGVGNGFYSFSPGQFNGGTHTGLQVSGTLSTTNGTDFGISSATNFFVNVAPEPSSLVLMGLGLASFAGASYRRRKTKSTAA